MTRSEPYALTELVHTTHINDVYDRRRYAPKDEAIRETREGGVVLWLRISEPQGEGVLVWRRGEELPQLLYFEA